MDAEAIVCHIKQRFPNLPIILLSASSETPEQILWLVDEYVMKSEIPESLISILEWVWRLAPSSDEGAHRRQAAAWASLLPRFRGNLFYVVQRYRTTSIPKLDCHNDLHCSVQNACFRQRKPLYILVFFSGS